MTKPFFDLLLGELPMTRAFSLRAAICILCAAMASSASAAMFNFTLNSVTYTVVEADGFDSGGVAGNTVNMDNPGQFFSHTPTAAPFNADGLWRWRDFGGMWFNQPAGTVQSDRDLFEVSNQAVAPPNLRTTANVPNGSYDVFLAFLVNATGVPDATLVSDLDTGQSAPTTIRGPRTQPGIILTGVSVGGGGYEVAFAPLGTVTGSAFSVLAGPSKKPYPSGERGDYIGVAYVAIPEPGMLMLSAIGALSAFVRRHKSWKNAPAVV